MSGPGVERTQYSVIINTRAHSTLISKLKLFISRALNPFDFPLSIVLDFLLHLLDVRHLPVTFKLCVVALSAYQDPTGQVRVGADRVVMEISLKEPPTLGIV